MDARRPEAMVLASPCALVDEPVGVRFAGAGRHDLVTVKASCRDGSGVEFHSSATYRAGADGVVDPAREAPVSGTYDGVDPYGLWWSMGAKDGARLARDLAPLQTTICAFVGAGDRPAARLAFERLRLAPSVSVESVRRDGATGALFLPATLPAPGVMVLGGSEGGMANAGDLAALMASRGFVALAIAYFGVEGLSPVLAEVPIEPVEELVGELAKRPEVLDGGVGILGLSRGGELGLLIAADRDDVRAVVGASASTVVWPGFTPGASSVRSAWARAGGPVPFALPGAAAPGAAAAGGEALAGRFLAGLADEPRAARAAIPVERVRGPVLLVSGGDDHLWPSREFAAIGLRRRAGQSAASGDRHLTYPRAGHQLLRAPGLPAAPPTLVAGGLTLDLGGTRADNARAAAAAWPQVIAFLRRHLPSSERSSR